MTTLREPQAVPMEAYLKPSEINDIPRTWDGGYHWRPKDVADVATEKAYRLGYAHAAGRIERLRAVVTLARDDSNGDFVILADDKEFRRIPMPKGKSQLDWQPLVAVLPVTMWRAFNEVFKSRAKAALEDNDGKP